jgi:probable F420-dependent oxidoreductase
VRLDAFGTSLDIAAAGDAAASFERVGYHGLWLAETQFDPFLPLAVAATRTSTLRLGTAIAVAFPRSPMLMAMDAWAIQRASGGRLDLGLGTQVRAHIERRFSVPFERPAARMREYVQALRHIWGAFQHEHPLRFRGEFYQFSLLTPFFDPGPIEHPRIDVLLAAVNTRMFVVAGEVGDGVVAHPFHTAKYLRDIALPALQRGLKKAARERAAFSIVSPVFTLVRESDSYTEDERYVRQQLAFYASTPTYRPVLTAHGWDSVGEELSALASRGRFEDLARVVTDEMMDAFVTYGRDYADLAQRLRERYSGLIDRIGLYGGASTRVTADDVATLVRVLADS